MMNTTSLMVLDRALSRFNRQYFEGTAELQRRIGELGHQYAAATDVPSAMALEDEQALLAKQLRALHAVRDNARNALQAARHEAGRRTDRILWLREAIAGAEDTLARAKSAETRQLCERDLGAWRPMLEELEREDAAVITKFEGEDAVAA